jgi:hypothetical protein
MRSKLGALVKVAYFVALAWLTVEILIRRWVWDQVPTQVSTVAVYLTVALDFFVLAGLGSRLLSRLRTRRGQLSS